MRSAVLELEARLIRVQSAVECLDTLLALAQLHAAGFRNREGLRSAREALNIARARNDKVAIGRALATATLCHYQRGDYAAAIATGLDAVEAYSDDDLPGRSNALQSIALALFAVEARDLALSVADRAVDDARSGADPALEAAALSVRGAILGARGSFNAARRQFRRAGALYRRLGDTVKLKKAASNIAHCYRKQGNAAQARSRMAEARLHWRQALRVYRIALQTGAGQSDADDAIILGGIAECECKLGELRAAYGDVGQAVALARAVGCPVILAPCLLQESHILREMDEGEAAMRSCECARAVAEQLEDAEILVECIHAQAKLNDLQGRFEAAADLEKRANDVFGEREASFKRMRVELGPLWERYTAVRPAPCHRAAA